MHTDLSPVIAATAQWLTRSFPSSGGALAAALCEVQARQAVTVAARLRYPTEMDVALVGLTGPGGSGRLDRVTGADAGDGGGGGEGEAWRTWVDEVVASWAVCLLADAGLAAVAVGALDPLDGDGGVEFRRLVSPGEAERGAAALLRHPDLVAPVAALHRSALLGRLDPDLTFVR
ncbi:hypothetical protein ACFY3N_29100 [Streptomyces sp. NPDC000348]|uniref:hypothetical protein n=1 Tax=Streptomyces sp. NPDC000348 TaxID=3364538 RepID=UPI0036C4F771